VEECGRFCRWVVAAFALLFLRFFPLLGRWFDTRLESSLFTAVVFVVVVMAVMGVVCLCALFCSVFQVPNAKYDLASAVAIGVLLVGWWMAFVG
jgi:hypothetical protein